MIDEKSIFYEVNDVSPVDIKSLTGDIVKRMKATVTVIDESLEDSNGSSFRYPFKVLIKRDKNNEVEYVPKQEDVYEFLNKYDPKTEDEFFHDVEILYRIFGDPVLHEDCQHLMAKQTYELIPLTVKQEDLFSDDYVATYNVKYKTGTGDWTVSEVRTTCSMKDDKIEIKELKTSDTLLKDLKKELEKDIYRDLEEYFFQETERER